MLGLSNIFLEFFYKFIFCNSAKTITNSSDMTSGLSSCCTILYEYESLLRGGLEQALGRPLLSVFNSLLPTCTWVTQDNTYLSNFWTDFANMAKASRKSFDHFFKLLLIGDSGVGKTSIMFRCLFCFYYWDLVWFGLKYAVSNTLICNDTIFVIMSDCCESCGES